MPQRSGGVAERADEGLEFGLRVCRQRFPDRGTQEGFGHVGRPGPGALQVADGVFGVGGLVQEVAAEPALIHLPPGRDVVGLPVAPFRRGELAPEVAEVDLNQADAVEGDVDAPQAQARQPCRRQGVLAWLGGVGLQDLAFEVDGRQVVQPRVVLVKVRT